MRRIVPFGLIALLTVALPFIPKRAVVAQILPEPTTRIALPDAFITIQIKNQTRDAIEYQVVGDTGLRSLLGQSEVTLRSLRVPITLIFHYTSIPRSFSNRTGLIEAELIQDAETGDLELILTPTTDPALDSSSVEVDVRGDVYIF